jgi:Uma2 family endonuclease
VALPNPNHTTPEDFLTAERSSPHKHEYVGGRIYAMAGANDRHNAIVSSSNIALGGQLRKRPCVTYTQDMKVQTPSGMFAYPDLVVVCGDPQFRDAKRDVLLNPMVIIEVLSPSTEKRDRGEKFHHYRSIPSFQEYVLIKRNRIQIEHFTRQPDNSWRLVIYTAADSVITLHSIDCTLVVGEVYEKVGFGE